MGRLVAALLIFTLTGSLTAQQSAQVDWEQRFKQLPDPQRMKDNMQRLSARPHHVGSPTTKRMLSGSWRNISSGDGMLTLRNFRFSFLRRSCVCWR